MKIGDNVLVIEIPDKQINFPIIETTIEGVLKLRDEKYILTHITAMKNQVYVRIAEKVWPYDYRERWSWWLPVECIVPENYFKTYNSISGAYENEAI